MKIKCPCYPWCNAELELDKKTIGDHLFSKHRLDEVCMVLTENVFKIHEKIESLDNIMCMEGKPMELNQVNDLLKQELKSLLK